MIIFASLITSNAFSFTLILKDGRRIEGTWVTETKDVVQLKDQTGALRTFHKSELDMTKMARSARLPANNPVETVDSPAEPSPETVPKPDDTKTSTESSSDPVIPITTPPQIKPAPLDEVSTKRWAVEAGFSNVYESNINHDEADIVESVGLVSSLSARFRNRVTDPNILLRYEIGYHEYSNTDEWDRVSHNFRAAYLYRFGEKFVLENNGEVALNGSSEDRELGDQYAYRPVLRYNINHSFRIDLMAAYRYRKFETGTSAINRFAGIAMTKEFDDHELTGYYRYESNNSDNFRSDRYVKTYFAGYRMPFLWDTSVSFGARLRNYQYWSRLVEIEVEDGEDIEFLRRDRKWNFEIAFGIPIKGRFELVPQYEYEYRTSNDPEKPYDAHEVSLSLVYLVW